MVIDTCPLLEGDMVIPLYTNLKHSSVVLNSPSFTCRYSYKILEAPAITFLVAFASLSSIIFKISSSLSEAANLLPSAIAYLSSAVSVV